ncbi:hypothetical protein [Duganella sp. HH105]|uniref:hypothetical protein n=1 Tax=Duganella sp. HH105 TaxID=1781067 RepID=UPI00114CCECC|nr:hypothetical protein [Duganella sp. HH105]
MSKLIACTPFINILVKVRPGATPGTYKVETMPAVLRVSQPDTIINYQIFDSGSDNIVFTGMTVIPEENDQFSEESISISGKQLTFSDANTSKMKLNVTLHFKDDDGVEFMHDPEVENEPEGG